MVKLGPVAVERTCHTCGDIEFLDAEDVAYLEVPDRVPEEDTAQTSPTGWNVCHENLSQPPLAQGGWYRRPPRQAASSAAWLRMSERA